MTLTMAGRLSECILLAYRTHADSVRHLVPKGLELVTKDEWAFWNIVACRIVSMRWAIPLMHAGLSYHHIAYRLYVSARLADGSKVDGLYFVRSDSDDTIITLLGNKLTDFRFNRAEVELLTTPSMVSLDVKNSWDSVGNARVTALRQPIPETPRGSAFGTASEAALFLKYRPLGLSVRDNRVYLAEVLRDEARWSEEQLWVPEAQFEFLDRLGQKDRQLEMATRVAPIEYRWRLGRNMALA